MLLRLELGTVGFKERWWCGDGVTPYEVTSLAGGLISRVGNEWAQALFIGSFWGLAKF